MGEQALLVTLGHGLSPATNSRVHLLAARLRGRDIHGVIDLTPAYAALLCRFDGSELVERQLREAIEAELEQRAGAPDSTKRKIELPVSYGGEHGPDLAELAAEHNLTQEEVITLHTGAKYHVYFLGFMPGFAYLGGLPERLAAPRLATPRLRVPAGSVGIAGLQTGVYPLASPGGWRIIGRTPVQMWDAGRESPSLLLPGDEVRFRSTQWEPAPETILGINPAPEGAPAFEVLMPGVLTTLQDLGRPGYAALGLSAGGAMDPKCAARLNRLLGNPPDAAVLEVTWSGPSLRARNTTAIALGGADLGCTVDGRPVPVGVSWLVRAGTDVQFTRQAGHWSGARAYLAVLGGFAAPRVLGSRSTYLPAAFGGHEGRALRAGDLLRAQAALRTPGEAAGKRDGNVVFKGGDDSVTLRVMRYEGEQSPGETAFRGFVQSEFTVTTQSNRMGTRLAPVGRPNAACRQPELLSFGVVRGAVQLPPDGCPVVLNADHQTTGGYPLLGVTARADWPLLSSLMPGQRIRFEEISIERARLLLEREMSL